ncbi:MAG: pyrroline-5-carboxylate reductase [Gammaproteobacteria bacterium]|nr:pyrroline-5-carboxylate reductase [Gammaproteobacteria bacterium]
MPIKPITKPGAISPAMPGIGFIGGGNMATSLIGGLIDAGLPASNITVAEPDQAQREALAKQYAVHTTADNNQTLHCEIIVLAVKPQLLRQVCLQLDSQDSNHRLFISIAAGVTSTDINRWLSSDDNTSNTGRQAVVRCMPNTPSLLQCGASGMFANQFVNDTQKQQAKQIMQAVGIALWVTDEAQLNAVTAVSGSGPAYFFLLMEAMQQAGENLGLDAGIAQQLVLQTALGAARMAVESGESAAQLRQRVTSKGGTTEQAILSFQAANFQQIVADALQAANDRSISLAEELAAE